MRIWVDGQCFQTGSGIRGIGRYVIELLQAMQASGRVQLVISLNASMQDTPISARRYLERLLPQAQIEVWYSQTRVADGALMVNEDRLADASILRAHINSLEVDVALSPSHFEGIGDSASAFVDTKGIKPLTACIFHDAIAYRYPTSYLPNKVVEAAYFRRLAATPSFDVVMCNSTFTESEYRDIFGKDNVLSISAGLSNVFSASLAENAENPLGDIGPYMLYVGGPDWRKNVPFLVRGMAQIPAAKAGKLKLVLSGGNQEVLIDELRQAWAVAGLAPQNLITTGWVSDGQLAAIYRQAAVTVQPSLMEGFGLTAIEAMAAGSPFLGADAGAMPEVVKSADYLFDPHDPKDLADRVTRILNDREYRQAAIDHGYERLKDFTWEKSARLAIDALEKALGDRPRVIPTKTVAKDEPRLLMDVTSTALSAARTGIQRVMYRLSDNLLALNDQPGYVKTQLTFSRDTSGWYEMEKLEKEEISTSPLKRMGFQKNDTYFLMDSTWTAIEGQKARLVAAMAEGQEVIQGIYDLGPLTASALTHPFMPVAFRRWFEMVLSHSTGLICISRAVADEVYDLIEAIQLPRPMKIGYYELGADFADVSPDAAWLDFTGGRPTFLMVGTLEPRKGHWVALEAFERLWAQGVEANLLIIGRMGWSVDILSARLANHPEREKHLFVRNGISDAELRAAYDHCDALMMTSYLEGFGLPVVEAGALGCPVILADIPVFREVSPAAPAVRFFESLNPQSLADCVQEVIAEGFPDRKEDRVQWPNWQQSAQQIHDIIYGGKWYKRYEPREASPQVFMSEIGNVAMTKPLTKAQRKINVHCVEGPLLSEDGHEITFTMSLRNDTDVVLSSLGNTAGKYGLNLGGHIYDAKGKSIHFDGPRTSIPFVVLPGQEIFVSLRLPSDWITKGARLLGYEMVQEGVDWLGEIGRLDLLQPKMLEKSLDDITQWADFSTIHAVLPRQVFQMHGEDYAIVALYNGAPLPLRLKEGNTHQIKVLGLNAYGETVGIGEIANCVNVIAASGYTFMSVKLPQERSVERVVLRFGEDASQDWVLDLQSNKLFAAAQGLSTAAPAAKALAGGLERQRQEVFVDRYADLNDLGYLRTIFMLLKGHRIGDEALGHYQALMELGVVNRRGLAELILSDYDVRPLWLVQSDLPQQEHCQVVLNSSWSREKLAKYLEDRLRLKLPAQVKQQWIAQQMSDTQFATELQSRLEPFFNRLSFGWDKGANLPIPLVSQAPQSPRYKVVAVRIARALLYRLPPRSQNKVRTLYRRLKG